ncbi:MAG: rhomboid family intramembrane serine protease [Pyrobaculum sp.]
MAIPLRDINPTWSFPIVTKTLVFINIAVFIYQLAAPQITLKYAFIPALAFTETYRWITHMFLHGGVIHLVGNMIYLWVFGDNVEDRYGHLRFLALYLMWGVAAAFSHLLSILAQPAARELLLTPALGASGAISGVLGAYLVLFPHARIQTLVFFFIIAIVEIPAWAYIGFWFLFQLYYGVAELFTVQSSGVAYFAHIGGFIAGVLTALVYRGKSRRHWRYQF